MANNMRSIGATITLDGESQFRRSVTNCNTSLRTMRSEMQLVTEQYRGQANSMEALQAKHSVLERTLERSTALEQTLQQALENAERNYQGAGEQLEQYRRQLQQATTSLSELEAQQSDVADDSLAQQIAEQRDEMERLTDIVQRGERAYETAGTNVERWQQQLNSARTDVVRLQRELEDNARYMQEASESADGCATSIDEMGRQVRDTSRTIANDAGDSADAVRDLTSDVATYFTTDKLTEYADKVSDAFAAVASAAYDALQDIDEGYDTILTKTGATGDALDKFTGTADKIYGDLPSSMKDIGIAVGEINTRFGSTGDELDSLSRKFLKFANINETDLNGSIDGIQAAMSAFNVESKDASKVLDVMNVSAQKTGVSIDTLQSSLLQNSGAFRDMNMDIYESIDFVSKLEKSGVDASTVMAGLKKAYATTSKDCKDFRESLVEVQEALQGETSSVEANKLAYDMFGKSYGAIATAVRDGRLDFVNMANSMDLLNEAAGSVDNTFDASQDTWDEMTVAINNLKAVGGAMMADIMEIAAPAVELLADGLGLLKDGLNALPSPVRKTVSAVTLLGGSVGFLGPKLISLAETFRALRQAGDVSQQINDVRRAIDGLASAGEAAEAVGDVSEAVSDVARNAGRNADAVGDVADAVGDVAVSATTATAATGGFRAALSNIGSGLASAASKFGPYVALLAVAAGGLMLLDKLNKGYVEDLHEQDKALDIVVKRTKEHTDGLSKLSDEMSSTLKEADDIFTENLGKAEVAKPYIEELERLQGQSNKTTEDMQAMQATVDELNSLYPDLGLGIDSVTGKFTANGKAINDLSSYMDKYIKKSEQLAKQKYLNELNEKVVKAKIDFEVSKINQEQLKGKIEAELKKAGIGSIEEYNSMNILQRGALNLNPFDGLKNTAGLYEMIDEYNALNDAQKELANTYDEAKEKAKYLTDEITKSKDVTSESTGETNKQAESWTGAGVQADAAAQKYVDLAVKIKEAGGDIDVVSKSLENEESSLQDLFEQTSVAWQTSHDEITSGLADEVNQLAQNSNQWKQYRDDVASSIQSVSDMFSLREEDEAINWQSMQNGLVSNANAYDLWLANTEAVLQSARYANDEAFREIANTIMNAGIDSADYLDDFVQNVNLNTTTAYDDIAQFVELNGLQEKYAGVMANLKMATEEGMGGVAQVFDDTKTAAEMSMQEMSDMLQERSEMYNEYAENAKGIVESERYKTDENFRMYANTLLQQGIAGAEQVATLWSNLQSGSAQVDAAVQGYMSLQGAIDQYADVWASIQNTTQYGADGTVMIIDNAGDAWKQAAINDEMLLASGITGDKALSAVENMTQKTINALNSDSVQEEYYNAGKAAADAFAAGFEDSPLVHQYDGTGPLATLLKDNKSQKSVTNNMNLTVNQKDDGNWFSDITNWIRKQLS